jgi:hypothetical protein
MKQVNPPFDNSAVCPGCDVDVRGVSALMHNMMTRWPEGKAYVRLSDLAKNYTRPTPEVSNAAVVELLDVADLLVDAAKGITEDGVTIRWGAVTIRWGAEVTTKIAELVPRIESALREYNVASEAHFHDERHSSGNDNLLRAMQGSVGIRWLPRKDYNYTVEVVTDNGDMVHNACNTEIKLHDHFKEQIVKDRTFYGKVFCPGCKATTSMEQYKCRF